MPVGQLTAPTVLRGAAWSFVIANLFRNPEEGCSLLLVPLISSSALFFFFPHREVGAVLISALQRVTGTQVMIQGKSEVAGCFDSDDKNSSQQVVLPI